MGLNTWVDFPESKMMRRVLYIGDAVFCDEIKSVFSLTRNKMTADIFVCSGNIDKFELRAFTARIRGYEAVIFGASPNASLSYEDAQLLSDEFKGIPVYVMGDCEGAEKYGFRAACNVKDVVKG